MIRKQPINTAFKKLNNKNKQLHFIWIRDVDENVEQEPDTDDIGYNVFLTLREMWS